MNQRFLLSIPSLICPSELVTMKRIAVFGGTGLTGVLFCQRALEHGVDGLTIYARNPSKIPNEVSSHSSVKVETLSYFAHVFSS